MERRRAARAVRPIEMLERRLLFVLFGPDVSFGDGGVAPGIGNEMLAELPDGKIIAVGQRTIEVDNDSDIERNAIRLNADGTLDHDFAGGRGGIFLSNLAFTAVHAGSRFYVMSEALGGGGGADVERVIAYTIDGVVDTGFAGGAIDVPSTLESDNSGDIIRGRLIAATPDGGVLLLVINDPLPAGGYGELVRIEPDGGQDMTFGDAGFLRLPDDVDSQMDVRQTSNGIIDVSFVSGGGSQLTRYVNDGSGVDTTFGDNGTLPLPSDVLALAEQADGKLLIVRSPDTAEDAPTRRLYRLNADGSPDMSFGQSGSVALRDAGTGISRGAQIAVDSRQNIIVTSSGQLYRFAPTGAAEDEPLNGTFAFGDGLLAVDAADRILRGSVSSVTRLDELEPVAVGRDDILYVHGDAADDVVRVEDGPGGAIRVTRNSVVTDTPPAGIAGVTLRLGAGDNLVTSTIARGIRVETGDGADSITTGDGNDTIRPGDGDNVVDLGAGNDDLAIGVEIIGLPSRPDHHQISGGDGDKTIRVNAGHTTITLGIGNSTVETTATPANAVDDKNFDDRVTIAGGRNTVTMYGGHDTLEIGGNGNNHVSVGLNEDSTVTTGRGNDFFELFGNVTVNANAGDDSFAISSAAADDRGILIFAGDGNDRISAASLFATPRATIHGGNGHDYVNGGLGAQTIYGGAGNDTLWGGAGSDLISAGGGNDRVYADGGNDRVYGGNGRDRIYGGSGDDRLHGGAQGDWIYGQRGANRLFGDGGHDRLYGDHADSADTLVGGAGDDLLVSRDSLTDQLFGGRGNDAVRADTEDDALAGVESVL